jgi:hypothetical protein
LALFRTRTAAVFGIDARAIDIEVDMYSSGSARDARGGGHAGHGENGMEAQKRKQREFLELAGRFRGAKDPEEAKRLGDQLGRMVFGGGCPKSRLGTICREVSGST